MIIELLLYLFFFYPRVAYAKRMGIEEAMQRGLGMAAFESEASHSNSTVPSTRRGYLPTQVRQIAPWKPAQRTVSQRVSGINMLPTRKHFLTPKRALAFPHERHRACRLKVPSGRWRECAVQDNVSRFKIRWI